MLSLDFSSVEIGGLGKFLLDDEDDIFGSDDIGIDLAVAITSDNFFSIDTLVNMLIVFKAEGVDLADVEVMESVKAVTTATFFELTTVTFDFELFVEVLIVVDVMFEVVITEIEVALGYSICLGPGISVGFDGSCICDINLAIFDPYTFRCVCNAESGLVFDNEEAPTRCVFGHLAFLNDQGEWTCTENHLIYDNEECIPCDSTNGVLSEDGVCECNDPETMLLSDYTSLCIPCSADFGIQAAVDRSIP